MRTIGLFLLSLLVGLAGEDGPAGGPGHSQVDRAELEFTSTLFLGTAEREPAPAQRPLGHFEPNARGAAWRSASLPHPDGGLELLLESAGPGASADALSLWIDLNRDGSLAMDERLEVGALNATRPHVRLELDEHGLPFDLVLYVDGDAIGVTAIGKYHFEADLDVDGELVKVLVLDVDLSGDITADDRWAALTGPQLSCVRASSIYFLANLMSEPWYLGERTLRLHLEEEPRLTLGPATQPRHEFLAARAERVLPFFFEIYEEDRDAFLSRWDIDPERPIDPDPPAWYYAWDIDEALAFAEAEGRPLWVQFTSDGCGWCKRNDWLNERDAEVTALLRRFTLVKLDGERDPGQTAGSIGLSGYPSQALFDASGEALLAERGWFPPSAQVELLERALSLVPSE